MLTVRDIMTPDPITVQRATPLAEVIGLMKTHACRHLPVVDESQIVGIISDRDVRLVLDSPLIPHERSQEWELLQSAIAEACMTPDPMCVAPDMAADEVARLMTRYKFGALPVVEEERLVGIVTVSDILQSYITLLGKN